MYNEENPKMSITAFIDELNPKIRKKYEFVLKLISDENYQPREPYVKHFTIERFKKLYEIRLKASNTMLRIIYYEKNKSIVLLHAFVKKDKRDTEHALNHSLKLIEAIEKNGFKDNCRIREVMIT